MHTFRIINSNSRVIQLVLSCALYITRIPVGFSSCLEEGHIRKLYQLHGRYEYKLYEGIKCNNCGIIDNFTFVVDSAKLL